jgi:hypothetical protein
MASSTFVFPPNMATQNNAFCSPDKPFPQFAALFFWSPRGKISPPTKKTPGPDHNRL